MKATRIKVISSSNNDMIKILPNTMINYNQDYDSFLKMVAMSIRLSPDEPQYKISKIIYKNDNKKTELTSDGIKKFIQDKIHSTDSKVNIIVEVENDSSTEKENNHQKRNPSPIRYKSPVTNRNTSPVPSRAQRVASPLREQFTPKKGGPQQSPRRPLIAPSTPKILGTPKISKSIQKPVNPIDDDNGDDDDAFSLINSKGHYNRDGRPSISTMQAQWEFMREQFVSNNNEELEWQMIKNKKKKGQYSFCKKKYEESEDGYFKALADIELYENKCKLVVGPNAILTSSISSIAAEHETYKIYGESEESDTNIKASQNSLSKCLNDEKLLLVFEEESVKLLKLIAEVDVPKRAASLASGFKSTHMNDLVQSLTNELAMAKKKEQQTSDMLELWSRRQKESADYIQALYDEEIEWKKKEEVKNQVALRLMRSYLPQNVESMSVSDLMTSYKENGSHLTLELASELKNNRLLHFLVMHVEDIKTQNFLMGSAKQYFENLESLDIIELRALISVLPEKFDFDQNGKKMEWRQRLFDRVKLLVSQENGDEVKSTYDHTTNQRLLVKLPPLSNDQRRRQIYFYKTYHHTIQQLRKYEEKEVLLRNKTSLLEKVQQETIDNKREYDIILNEMRDPELKNKYDYSSVKDQAKKLWIDADANRKNLLFEVTRLETAINNNPISKEDFKKSMDAVETYFLERGIDWKTVDNISSSSSSIGIEGPFDPTPEIVKKVRETGAKSCSAAEEAMLRKQELSVFRPPPEHTVELVTFSSPVPLEHKSSNSMIKQRQASIMEASSSSLVPAASTENALTPKKLSSVNPEMLNVLNKMFSPALSSSTSSLTPKKAPIVISVDAKKDVDTKSNNSIDNKQTKSKLLQSKLMNTNETVPSLSPLPSNNKLSFLDAIKARKCAE